MICRAKRVLVVPEDRHHDHPHGAFGEVLGEVAMQCRGFLGQSFHVLVSRAAAAFLVIPVHGFQFLRARQRPAAHDFDEFIVDVVLMLLERPSDLVELAHNGRRSRPSPAMPSNKLTDVRDDGCDESQGL